MPGMIQDAFSLHSHSREWEEVAVGPEMLDLAVVLQELNGRAKKFGLVSVHGTSREGDIRSCFCAFFSEFREEEDLDQGRHGEGDKGFLHGRGHLVWRERAFTKDIHKSCRGDAVWLREARSRVQADGQQERHPKEVSRSFQTLQASGFDSEAILSCLRDSHRPRVRQFKHHNEIMTVIIY